MATGQPPTPRTRAWLGLLLACGALLLGLRAWAQWRLDPFVRTPINDALVYWRWSGAIAGGDWVGDTPFFSAPLYPYLLALVRALGGGIAAVLVVQVALHVSTAALLFRVARRWLAGAAALLAPACYLALADTSYHSLRVLNCALVAFLVAWLWERLLALRDEIAPARVASTGLALGLNVLANPVMLFAIPLVAAWTWRISRRALVPALGLALVASACVLPATLHNWLACREFVPVSAQAGVTFVHGNAPGADGTYHAIPGVSTDRNRQNQDARELVRGETDGSWAGTDRAFFRRGLGYWAAEPLAALGLALRKAWWFVSGRNYGDIYLPALEAEAGLDPWSWSAPLPAAWLVLPALLALFLARRSGQPVFPELLLLGLPFVTVVLFWYSPRYRLPALPLLAVLGAQAIAGVLAQRARDVRGACFALAFLASALSGELNRLVGFDERARYLAAHEHSLGLALAAEGALEQALAHQRRAAGLGDAEAGISAGDLLRRMGRLAEARLELEEALERSPESAYAHKSLAIVLAQSGELEPARASFEIALRLAPNDAETLSGLGNVRLQQGEGAAAVALQRAALALDPRYASAHFNLGVALDASGDAEAARASFEEALRLDPGLVQAWLALAELARRTGDAPAAARTLHTALAGHPGERALAEALAWLLAASPDASVRAPARALELAGGLLHGSEPPEPALLDLHAAALAADGRHAEAAREAERAQQLLRAQGAAPARLAELEARLECYRRGQAWVRPPR